MKKSLLLLAAVTLTLSSCIKGDDSYKEFIPVAPGMDIYSASAGQQFYASIPVNVAVRVALLAAEAQLSDPAIEDLSSVTYKGVNVEDILLGTNAKVEKVDGSYVVTDPKISRSYNIVGKVTIQTNGHASLADTDQATPWVISFGGMQVSDSNSADMIYSKEQQGSISLYSNNDGTFEIVMSNIRMQLSGVDCFSDWTGKFTLKAPSDKLAYSLCLDKEFEMTTGYAQGDTYKFINVAKKVPAKLYYRVEEGIYNGGTQILGGAEMCRLLSEHSTAEFPSDKVTYEWTTTNGQTSCKITYNGFTVTI